jgi:hypothetical protein
MVTPGSDGLGGQHVRSSHASLGARWSGSRAELSVEVGRRSGLGVESMIWWRNQLGFHLTPTTALVLRDERLSPELVLGVEGRRRTMMGIEFRLPSRPKNVEPKRLIELFRTNQHRVLVVLSLPIAKRAALASDATGWGSIELTHRADGRWEAWLEVGPGIYRMNVSLDGGAWIAPPGARVIADDFGGTVGLVVL